MFQLLEKDSLFWICALAGSALFVIQFLLNLFGGDMHDDDSADFDSGHFKWLSKQAITGFLMMFGWIGLTCKKEFDCSLALSIIIALAGGLLSFFITGLLFRAAKRLRSPGAVFCIEDAIGKKATVYQRIPVNGTGKISISLHNLTYEIDAISNCGEIPSFTQVQIIKKTDDNTVIVVPIK